MNDLQFSCVLTNDSLYEDLALEIWYNNKKFFDSTVLPGSNNVSYTLNEDINEHVLKFVLKNKTDNHTTLDENNKITSDAVIQIQDVIIDNTKLNYLFYANSKYKHNFNGNGNSTVEDFFGTMGCNGTVEFKFTTPFYVWLLEHM